MGGYNSGLRGSLSQALPQQQVRANVQPQHQQRQEQQQQQLQPFGSQGKIASQGDLSQQQQGSYFQQPSQQQMNQVGQNDARLQTSAASLSTSMSGTRTNSASPVALANAVAGSDVQGQQHPPQRLNLNSNQIATASKLTSRYSSGMQPNNNLSPYPTNPNNYQPQAGQAAYPLPPSPMQQSSSFQGQSAVSSSESKPNIGVPVVSSKTRSQNQVPVIDPNKQFNQNAPSMAGNSVGIVSSPQQAGGHLSSKGNVMVPDVAVNKGQGYPLPQSNSSPQSKMQGGTTRLQPSQSGTQSIIPGQQRIIANSPAGQKGDGVVKHFNSSVTGVDRAGTITKQTQTNEMASHPQHAQQQQQNQQQQQHQHSQVKTNKDKMHQSGKQPATEYRPSSNSQQWADPSAYLPYSYSSTGSGNQQQQQQPLQPSLGSGGYFDPVPSRYYPAGNYGQIQDVGYGQDNIPSSLFGNTASADEFSQFGRQYLSQDKNVGSNAYLSGRYPDMTGYDGSPSASSSSQYLQPSRSGSGGGTYDFDGEYHSPQSYQDMEFYSPMTGQQGYKSRPPPPASYKAQNSEYKSAYGARPGLYEGKHHWLLVVSFRPSPL